MKQKENVDETLMNYHIKIWKMYFLAWQNGTISFIDIAKICWISMDKGKKNCIISLAIWEEFLN